MDDGPLRCRAASLLKPVIAENSIVSLWPGTSRQAATSSTLQAADGAEYSSELVWVFGVVFLARAGAAKLAREDAGCLLLFRRLWVPRTHP